MTDSDVAILGGGLGGLTAGLALARAGLEVVVLEARQSPAPDHWGFILWPPGTRTLSWLGVLDQVVAEGCRLKAFRCYAADGHEWMSVDLERLSALGPFVGVLPSRLEAILTAEAGRRGMQIIAGAKGWELERDRDGSFRIRVKVQGEDRLLRSRLVVGADGPDSLLRRRMRLRAWRWRPRRQLIVTGIGGGLEFQEMRQAIAAGWSGGCVSLGPGKSWIYTIVRQGDGHRGLDALRRYGRLDLQLEPALADLRDLAEVRPWSVRVPRWAGDGMLLIGDAAHAMLPHLGLGGSLTLEDIPALSEVVTRALRGGDTSASALDELRRRRRGRVSFARRVSESWAFALTSRLPGLRFMRDRNLRRLSRRPELMEALVRELAGSEVPGLRTRLAAGTL